MEHERQILEQIVERGQSDATIWRLDRGGGSKSNLQSGCLKCQCVRCLRRSLKRRVTPRERVRVPEHVVAVPEPCEIEGVCSEFLIGFVNVCGAFFGTLCCSLRASQF